MYNLQTFSTFLDTKLREITKITLITHRAPDGDAYGSLAGMYELLKTNYTGLHISLVVPPEAQVDNHVSWILSAETTEKIP
jgi:nanoRNase/pAp phosphatase (c-di-AMP/oligoRNAs hydrolase)